MYSSFMEDLRKIKSLFDLMLGSSKKDNRKLTYPDRVRDNMESVSTSLLDKKMNFVYTKSVERPPQKKCKRACTYSGTNNN